MIKLSFGMFISHHCFEWGSLAGEHHDEKLGKACDCKAFRSITVSPCSDKLVCGADGNTYANACLAECQGIRIDRMGSCEGALGM
jgi:hypothetical protein